MVFTVVSDRGPTKVEAKNFSVEDNGTLVFWDAEFDSEGTITRRWVVVAFSNGNWNLVFDPDNIKTDKEVT